MSLKNKKVKQRGNKFPLAMILMFFVVLAACGGAGYMFYEMKKMTPLADGETVPLQADAQPVLVEPLYVSLGTFTVSLKSTSDWQDPVAYIGLTLRVSDEKSKQLIETFLPEIRSRIFMLLTLHVAEDLLSHEGKQRLIENINSDLKMPLAPGQHIQVVDVLINEFIIR